MIFNAINDKIELVQVELEDKLKKLEKLPILGSVEQKYALNVELCALYAQLVTLYELMAVTEPSVELKPSHVNSFLNYKNLLNRATDQILISEAAARAVRKIQAA